jgi:hypothetical protein
MLKRIFAAPAQPPHNVPGLIDKVKDLRKTIEESAKH